MMESYKRISDANVITETFMDTFLEERIGDRYE